MGHWLDRADIEAIGDVVARHAIRVMDVLMSALDDLNTAIANLTAAVDADIAAHQAVTGGLTADEAAAATAQVQAEADKLTAAATPPA